MPVAVPTIVENDVAVRLIIEGNVRRFGNIETLLRVQEHVGHVVGVGDREIYTVILHAGHSHFYTVSVFRNDNRLHVACFTTRELLNLF